MHGVSNVTAFQGLRGASGCNIVIIMHAFISLNARTSKVNFELVLGLIFKLIYIKSTEQKVSMSVGDQFFFFQEKNCQKANVSKCFALIICITFHKVQ